jgi:hypothetical protein
MPRVDAKPGVQEKDGRPFLRLFELFGFSFSGVTGAAQVRARLGGPRTRTR